MDDEEIAQAIELLEKAAVVIVEIDDHITATRAKRARLPHDMFAFQNARSAVLDVVQRLKRHEGI